MRRAVAVLALLACACNRSAPVGSYGAAASPGNVCQTASQTDIKLEEKVRKDLKTCRIVVHMTIKATGAEQVDLEGDLSIITNEFFGPSIPKETRFANMGTEVPQDLPVPSPGKLLVQTSFDIAPGTYNGPGRYTLRPRGAKVEGLPVESGVTSEARLIITSITRERPGVFTYNRLVEPCTVRLTTLVASGSLRCPKLGQEDGEGVVDLRVDWQPVRSR